MKHTLWVMGLILGLCPLWAVAQMDADDSQGLVVTTAAENWVEAEPQALAKNTNLPLSYEQTNPDWVNALGVDFRGSSDFKYTTSSTGSIWPTGAATNRWAYARLDIPHGRKITFFRLWAQDFDDPGNVTATLREVCLPDLASAANPTVNDLAAVTSSGTPGSFTVVATLSPPPVVDAHLCTYWALIQFGPGGNFAVRKIHVEHKK